MDIKQLITDYLQEARLMQVATVKYGKPWVCTVNFAVDEDFNLYWMSLRSTHHSQQLAHSPSVAGAIVKDPTRIQGIQFEGTAQEVTGEELDRVNAIYQARYGDKPERLQEAKSNDPSVRGYYKIIPTKLVLFDKINFPDNPRQEYKV